MSSASVSLQMLSETQGRTAADMAYPSVGKLQRNSTVSSTASTAATSSSASGVSSQCSSDTEDFPALPSLSAQSKAPKQQRKSVWFSEDTVKMMKPKNQQTPEPVAPIVAPSADTTPAATSTCSSSCYSTCECLPCVCTYPTDMVVRNTFLDFEQPCVQPAAGRRARSAEPVVGRRTDARSEEFLRAFTGIEAEAATVNAASSNSQGADTTNDTEKRPVLDLASAIPLPEVGTAECPTIGSVAHVTGQCKPCAFFWKPRGCANGAECPFCHLCDANEKKRRQKEKKLSFNSQHLSFCLGGM